MKTKILGLLATGLLAGPVAAHASIITFNYTAEGIDPSTTGATATGTFGYDTSTGDSQPNPNQGAYNSGFFTGAVVGGSQDGFVFNLTNLGFFVDNSSPDMLFITGSPTLLILTDYQGTAFGSDALPTNLSLADFEDSRLRIYTPFTDPNQPFYRFTSISLAGQAVPEPATLALLGLGLAGLGLSRRRKAN